MNLEQLKVDVPVGKSGNWEVAKFEVTEQDAQLSAMRALFQGNGRRVRVGHYTGLYCCGEVIMSDTHDEIRDHMDAYWNARGHCLVNGLGLGMITAAMLNKPEVERVTVIELSEDVIKLVAPHLKVRFGDRLEIVHADALTYQPPKGVRYGCVWHDIWPSICSDNLEEMKKLHRKYGSKTDWQGSWCRGLCERQNFRDKRADAQYRAIAGILGGVMKDAKVAQAVKAIDPSEFEPVAAAAGQ